MAASPTTTWELTLAPLTVTDGVAAAKSTTGRLKATATCGESLVPVWKTEVKALGGSVAPSGCGCGASASAGVRETA